MPGFDVYDAGARLNVGVRASAYWSRGREAQVLVGRSFRNERNPLIPVDSGYGRADPTGRGASAARFAAPGLQPHTARPRQLRPAEPELGASFPPPGAVRRSSDDRTDPSRAPELEFATNIYRGERAWCGSDARTQDTSGRSDIGIIYRDECTRIEVVYHHEADSIRLGGSSDSIQIRLILATLADPGYRNPSDQW